MTTTLINELERKKKRIYYQSVIINGNEYSLGDSIKRKSSQSQEGPKFGIIESIYTDSSHTQQQKYCKIRWYYRRCDIEEDTYKQYLYLSSTSEDELFYTLHTEVRSIQELLNYEKIDILILCKEENEQIEHRTYFIRSIFDQASHLFYPIAPSSLNLPSVKKNKKIFSKLSQFFDEVVVNSDDNHKNSSTEKTLLISELMRFEEMMDMKIPIPNFEDKGSVLNTLNFSLNLLDSIDDICNKTFSDLPTKLRNLENEVLKLQCQIIEEDKETQRSTAKLNKLLLKLPLEYRNKSLAELLSILRLLQSQLTETQSKIHYDQQLVADSLPSVINNTITSPRFQRNTNNNNNNHNNDCNNGSYLS